MELDKLIQELKKIPDQKVEVGQIYVPNSMPMVVLMDGRTLMLTDRGIKVHDPKYRPDS